MKLHHWLAVFLLAALAAALLVGAWNLILDPFGVFGDPVLDWYEYDMTMNPRVAKIAWLERHSADYDAYVIGSSKASSIPVEKLNEYTGRRFYNMTWYGGDLLDEAYLVSWLLDNCRVRHIVLCIDPQDAVWYGTQEDPIKNNMHAKADGSGLALFYLKYLAANPAYGLEKLKALGRRGYLMNADAVYIAETGVYNKERRDNVPIADMASYLERENNLVPQEPTSLPHLAEAAATLRSIVELCRERDVQLTVIGVPIYNDEFYKYDEGELTRFWVSCAGATDFYDFWGNNAVNGDIRYFYDTNHFRNDVGLMVLRYVFGDKSGWLPEGFGHLTTAENAAERARQAFADRQQVPEGAYTARVPVLMYHSFTEDPAKISDMVSRIDVFEETLKALKEAGWQTVTYDMLESYVLKGADLPEKSFVISVDDGYGDNLTLMAPVLERYGYTAEVSVIGVSVGKDTYKDTGKAMLPHFSLEEARPWEEKGVIRLRSHTYDMHQVTELDGEGCRKGVVPLAGESDEEFARAILADFEKSRAQLEAALGEECYVLTYPYGLYDILSEVVLHSAGARVTVSTDKGTAELVRGLHQSLYAIKRETVTGSMGPEDVLIILEER